MRFLSYAYRFLSNFIFLALVYYQPICDTLKTRNI
jgi:hypothetical protein